MSVSFDISDIRNSCQHLEINLEDWGTWFEWRPEAIYLHFHVPPAHLIALIEKDKEECIDFCDDNHNWQELEATSQLPVCSMLHCRYIFLTN